jgi:hypothetical protein
LSLSGLDMMIVLENGLTFDTRVYIRPFWSVKDKPQPDSAESPSSMRAGRGRR